ncbi:PIG-L deacetylase family protein [Roseomonas elaeocarpi]|uniref:PIG-L deacetylase family protein n=1 Tax=Roseomonas elaeocarpi TaxID=907779 RepID=A0ABV6JQ78_9PROT
MSDPNPYLANPYLDWVRGLEASLRAAAALEPPAPAEAPAPAPAGTPERTALIFAPHPDDEVIVGALALRLQRELGFRVTDVAVTLGSNLARRPGRLAELRAACRALGFALALPVPDGLSGINPRAEQAEPENWEAAVAAVAALLEAHRPAVVFLPHEHDWNVTHTGTHRLVLAAMRRLPALRCLTVETEFWGAMAAPNLMVESSAEDVAELVSALALHRGEVARNPYHLRLPAWMIDNVRRGAELVGGQGGTAPDLAFATLYRLRRWEAGAWHEVLPAGQVLGRHGSLAPLFAG